MEVYQAFKQARIEHGFSIDSFSEATGIKPRTLISYENGDRSLEGLMVYKGLSLFEPLEISPEEFDKIQKEYNELKEKFSNGNERQDRRS